MNQTRGGFKARVPARRRRHGGIRADIPAVPSVMIGLLKSPSRGEEAQTRDDRYVGRAFQPAILGRLNATTTQDAGWNPAVVGLRYGKTEHIFTKSVFWPAQTNQYETIRDTKCLIMSHLARSLKCYFATT